LACGGYRFARLDCELDHDMDSETPSGDPRRRDAADFISRGVTG